MSTFDERERRALDEFSDKMDAVLPGHPNKKTLLDFVRVAAATSKVERPSYGDELIKARVEAQEWQLSAESYEKLYVDTLSKLEDLEKRHKALSDNFSPWCPVEASAFRPGREGVLFDPQHTPLSFREAPRHRTLRSSSETKKPSPTGHLRLP